MLRYAVVYNEQDIFVEIPEDKFRESLIVLTKETKDVGTAFDKLHKELELAVRRK